jgi:thiol reductant ABC exporter CydD subunit
MRPFDPRLLRAVPATRRPVAALAAIGIAQGIATIATAFALASLVVAVVRGSDLLAPLAWTGGLFAARALLGALSETVAARAGAAVATGLREQLLAAWAARGERGLPSRTGALTLAVQGTSTVEPYVARYLPALVGAAVVPALAIACLVVVDWPSAAIVVGTVWLLPLFAALIGATTQADTERRWGALADLSGHFLDVVRGLPTLVAYGRAERQTATIAEVSQRHRRATMRTLRLAFMSAAALELLATISVAIVAVVVGLRLTHGSMDLLVGLTAILLAPEAYWPIRRVGTEFHAAADGAAALDEILAELAPSDPTTSQNPRVLQSSSPTTSQDPRVLQSSGGGSATGEVVSVTGVDYTHPGAKGTTLTGVDLVAGRGLTVVTGPSGCGKTTLLEVIAGTRTADRGEVVAGPVHMVTQRPFLGAGTLRDNLTIGGPQESADLWRVLREVGLDGVVAGLPDGLETRIGDDGFGLSAGQRARLVLARAILSPAPVLLLDEVTAHVDADSVATLGEVIARLAKERTVIAVTHQPDLVARADEHVALRQPEVAR